MSLSNVVLSIYQRLDLCYKMPPFFCPKKKELSIFKLLQLYILYCYHPITFFVKIDNQVIKSNFFT